MTVTPTGPAEDAVLLYVGGPLDGRVEVREARHGAPLPVVTHTHLHLRLSEVPADQSPATR